MVDDHYKQMIKILSTGKVSEEFTTIQKKQLVIQATDFHLVTKKLYKMGPDEILHQYVLPHEKEQVLA